MSFTRVWEPKPIASPITPAPAIRGPMLMPTDDRMIRLTITNSTETRNYAEFHFASEENIAASISLSGIEDHHVLHLQLLEDLNHYAKDLDNGLKTIDEFFEFITDWFLVHTQHEDRNFFKAKT